MITPRPSRYWSKLGVVCCQGLGTRMGRLDTLSVRMNTVLCLRTEDEWVMP